ncbi:ferritin-like domain-containing protein [Nonomuraea sediminis]|uniref:ferritin-like domain-containing protein n=1 Tax=Nonomuraea sediminis TaxID=2835864 RepID=UPI001BDCC35C|nr:ferritin-like domain-containing protein [Nonomuraea sediminis]
MMTARESVERAGLDVGALLAGLTAAAKAELAAVYHYTILSAACAGLAGEELPALLRDIRDEDRRHFDALVTRMYELDGRLPEDIRVFVASEAPYEDPLGDSRDLPPARRALPVGRRRVHRAPPGAEPGR